MTIELREEIEHLKAEIAALKDERLPKVDRASKRRDRRQVLGGFGMFAVAILLAGTMSASALAGSNTVTTGDIVDGDVHNSDLGSDSVTAGKVKNGALAGADIKDGSLTGADLNSGRDTILNNSTSVSAGFVQDVSATCPEGKTATGGGYEVSSAFQVFASKPASPNPSNNKWIVTVKNTSANAAVPSVYVVCDSL